MDKNSILGNLQFQNNKKKTVQEFGDIKIENNAIYYDKAALQISNISRTWIGKFDKAPFPIWTILGITIALVLLFTKSTTFIVIGLLIGVFCAYIIYNYISNATDKFGLQIEMNSGFVAIFSSVDENFLIGFQNAITNDFIERTGATTINLDRKTIVDNKGVISYGDNATNTMN